MGDFEIPLGQARVVREGTDVTIVSWGQQVKIMEQAVRHGRLGHHGFAAVVQIWKYDATHGPGDHAGAEMLNKHVSDYITLVYVQAVELQEEGVSCEVIDLRTLLPWDSTTVGMLDMR